MVNAPEPSAEELRLAEVAATFLNGLQDLTPGKSLEAKLNAEYGPGNALYDEMAKLSRIGLDEGSSNHLSVMLS